MGKHIIYGMALGAALFLILQAYFLPCGKSCEMSYRRTAITDVYNGGNWSLRMWEGIAEEVKKEQTP